MLSIHYLSTRLPLDYASVHLVTAAAGAAILPRNISQKMCSSNYPENFRVRSRDGAEFQFDCVLQMCTESGESRSK